MALGIDSDVFRDSRCWQVGEGPYHVYLVATCHVVLATPELELVNPATDLEEDVLEFYIPNTAVLIAYRRDGSR
jgi:hypothetical protein